MHRRLLYDDYRGVGEPLSEPGEFDDGLVVRGRLLLTLAPPDQAADAHRPLAQGMVLQPFLSFQDGTPSANSKLEVCGRHISTIYCILIDTILFPLSFPPIVFWASGCSAPGCSSADTVSVGQRLDSD